MAAWQFDLFLMPEAAAMPSDTEGGLDIQGLPLGVAPYIQESLITCFGQPWLMLGDWLVFGNEKGTRVDLIFDETDIVDLHARLDVSVDNGKVLDILCAMAQQLGYRYFDVEGKQFIEPQKEALLQAMNSSGAARFVKDPKDFITKLAAASQKE